jgi:hypothetical protein
LETRGALKEVCAFIAREASAKTKDAASRTAVRGVGAPVACSRLPRSG